MPASYDEDIALANAFTKRYSFSNFLKGESEMNTYERTVISKYMNIEYGSGASIEQLTMAYGYFGATIDKIKAAEYEVPSDLQAAFDACDRDLKIKIRENRLKEIKSLEFKREQLLTNDEKLAKIDADLAKLRELVK
jgi:hypothetical protein